jgi:DNA gyrase subunit B/topoisomerase-4 subunit B
VVNALSERMVAMVRRDGQQYVQEFRRGKARGPLEKRGPARGTGTLIRFTPDEEIFGPYELESDWIQARLEVSAYLNKGLRIVFKDEGTGDRAEFKHDGGLRDFLAHKIEADGFKPTVQSAFHLDREEQPRIEVALTWTDAPREKFRSFVNGIPTTDGGTHEQGMKDAVVKAVRNYVETHDISVPRGVSLTADDIREGVVALCSVFLSEPQFQGQTKEKLNNPEVRGIVDNAVRSSLEQWLHDHKTWADAIVTRVIMAAKARHASRAATDQVRRKSAVSHRLNLPGKLADCSSTDPSISELFIVEGDSAGGSAKQGRDRKTQAILPLRGKVLNSEQASLQKVLANNELSNIIRAVGCGIGKDLDLGKLRYHKIILLMDADSDGHHIATLLLTFFYRHLPELVDGGFVYLAQPPLYRIEVGKSTWWARDDREKEKILAKLPARSKPEVSRFKGLGEMMPKTLFRTTLDPKRRSLLEVTIPDGARLETETVISDLMGKDPSTRFREIMQWMELVEDLDV